LCDSSDVEGSRASNSNLRLSHTTQKAASSGFRWQHLLGYGFSFVIPGFLDIPIPSTGVTMAFLCLLSSPHSLHISDRAVCKNKNSGGGLMVSKVRRTPAHGSTISRQFQVSALSGVYPLHTPLLLSNSHTYSRFSFTLARPTYPPNMYFLIFLSFFTPLCWVYSGHITERSRVSPKCKCSVCTAHCEAEYTSHQTCITHRLYYWYKISEWASERASNCVGHSRERTESGMG
jgi:hypothetical protein